MKLKTLVALARLSPKEIISGMCTGLYPDVDRIHVQHGAQRPMSGHLSVGANQEFDAADREMLDSEITDFLAFYDGCDYVAMRKRTDAVTVHVVVARVEPF